MAEEGPGSGRIRRRGKEGKNPLLVERKKKKVPGSILINLIKINYLNIVAFCGVVEIWAGSGDLGQTFIPLA
ncbi:MAG TPA: hypothetical protein GX518_01320 [Firmicutes bacterium]|nr:hypothetical protein [Bacillota bacterium]